MTSLLCYKTMPVWTKDTIPSAVTHQHNTQAGTWGKLRVLAGRLKFHELTEGGATIAAHILTPESDVWTIYPQQWHRVELLDDDTQMQLEFHCEPADYFAKKYGMTRTHSAVVAASDTVPPGKALDLGCGQGRNALYLALTGHDVTASDYNPGAAENVARLAARYGITDRHGALGENYDYIVATVVFMFLDPERIPAILADIQAHTRPGGYNLIVSAMNTADYPCQMPFSFTFRENELRDYYAGWKFITYDEAPGNMHATDASGNPIRLKFVTMLAQKPS